VLVPVVSELKAKRVLVVADGALHYVPFAALPLNGSPLILSKEIAMLPSASVVALLRTRSDARHASKAIAVLADPVLRADDPRVTHRDQPVVVANVTSDVMRSGREVGIDEFHRLPETRTEADAILSMLPASQTLRATGFDASRETALNPDLRDYRIIHFATHALVNSYRPELSGVVLSLIDEKGDPRDGFLRLQDIFNLELNADLVVLSACRTALGRNIKGEGVVGLSRGFMYAGAPRVIASLWDVRDATTAEFMKLFYRRMIQDKRTAAAALRDAQIAFAKQRRAPFYWAPFVLQGEWR
jgi:CHAT domain-containing protein